MSVQSGLDFLHALRGSAEIQARLVGLGDYDELAGVAAEAGYDCTADDLDQAFRHECAFRRARYFGRSCSVG